MPLRTELYPHGGEPTYVPAVTGVEVTYKAGYLKQNVQVVRGLLKIFDEWGQEGPVHLSTWDATERCGLDPKKQRVQFEKAAVCAGCEIRYIHEHRRGKGNTIRIRVSRGVMVPTRKPLERYLKEVAQFVKKKKGR